VETEEGVLIGVVSNIIKTNKYFESAGAVSEYNKSSDLFHAFPVKEWEYTMGDARALGVYDKNGMLQRPAFPPSPGDAVKEVDAEVLNRFLGLDQGRGICLGEVQQHDLKAKFNLTRMIQKHLAILAISGAGKSYAVAVLLEELLLRDDKDGRVALIAIDNHGEYTSLGEDKLLGDKVTIINGDDIKIGVRGFSEKGFASLLPGMSSVQVRELGKILSGLRKEKDVYSLNDVMDYVAGNDNITKATKEALLGWLNELKGLNIFSTGDYPNIKDMVKQGHLVVINLRDILSLKKKQLIVRHISKMLFDYRRKGLVPPYLEIIEEAHNFCPEGKKSSEALSRGIIETLAREGRKFYANICLVSQRPIQLSTTALSQCNTQLIMRITNPYDLKHIGESSESLNHAVLDIITSLKVGEALVVGEAVNHPVFVKVRKRKTQESHGTSLEDYAILYEKKVANGLAKGEDFI